MVTVEITVVPLGTKKVGLSEYVAKVVKVIENEGIPYELTPTSTIFQAELSKALEIVRKMHEEPFKYGVERVYTIIKIDERKDKRQSLTERVRAVKGKM
jgi:uncharacterized protein (TIGR00106 family)